jgi:IclR family mhp operon transcriptional activator
MESIQSVFRCFDVLRELNIRNGATVHDMRRHVDLPRGTIYRMLETLCAAGYARRDSQTGGYWVEGRTRDLSSGHEDQRWVLDGGPPVMADLRPHILCCMALSTPSGTDMLIRFSSKRKNPVGSEKSIAGRRDPMASNVDGHVYLAFLERERRDALLTEIFRRRDTGNSGGDRKDSNEFSINSIALSRAAAVRELDKIRQRGCTTQLHGRGCGATAVPIVRDGGAIGALKIWYWLSVIKEPDLSKRILPLLQDAARRLSEFSESPASGQSTDFFHDLPSLDRAVGDAPRARSSGRK